MNARRIAVIAVGVFAFTSIAATRSVVAPRRSILAQRAPTPCTLLTTSEATTALGVASGPGKEYVGPTGCAWSNDPAVSDTSRRILLNTHTPLSFRVAMHPAITTIRVEPVSGIGDEAFYQIYPRQDGPFIWVRKGAVAFSIRLLTGHEPPPFTEAQEKAKEAVLARAAVARL